MRIEKGQVLRKTLLCLSKMAEGEALLVQPFKRDRSICVIRRKDSYHVFEWGFVRQEFTVEIKNVKKLLKSLYKKELPRSNTVWITSIAAEDVDSLVTREG